MFHHVFVKGESGNEITIELLKYLHSNITHICKSGIRLVIHKITPKMLKSKDAIEKLKASGVNTLPSISVSDNIIEGYDDIVGYYEYMLSKHDNSNKNGKFDSSPNTNTKYNNTPYSNEPYDSNDIMSNYMNREMSNRDDEVTSEDGGTMLEKKYKDYMSKLKVPPKTGKKGSSAKASSSAQPTVPEQLQNAYRDAGGDGDGGQDDHLLQKLMDNIGYE